MTGLENGRVRPGARAPPPPRRARATRRSERPKTRDREQTNTLTPSHPSLPHTAARAVAVAAKDKKEIMMWEALREVSWFGVLVAAEACSL